ncbi:ABC1 kinase family protein [Aliiruegeria lutimaris]|uniref:Predicted unusual protein kinase regulating ubiquinone biosynthesis, AarF/ABC1/UbiB family n=1 Tax=Aliiruegeria lutimaris TaxID=571298 RepID=A0A1G9KLL4_9RHOB|nr:AarF/ABC1/UbiB kinase family protein [Aliiruegeria lutimaris]SDL50562.1 Predicted unusual protein kinase regulating ubiquinone biosynthesis, AarF/ABC1/UbiB family [Aliiruegeria lutimaris]
MTAVRNLTRKVPAGRISRLHRLGALATGIAGRLAVDGVRKLSRGESPELRSLLLTPTNARRIAEDLAHMRGAAMKMGQFLSMEAGDVLPPEMARILARLRDAADPMPPRHLKVVLREAWGDGWRREFRSFDTRPIAAASIGQVHRARLRDGRELAIKVQYPGIADSIDSDVANLGSLLRLSGLLPRDFDLAPYLAAARAQLRDEANYEQEARAMASYAAMMGGTEGFVLPDVLPDWSTRSVLSMTYLPSRPIESLEQAPQAERDRAMQRLLALFLDEVFTHRTVQTDPNFANYRHCPRTGRIVLLDFGAVREFDPAFTETIRDLLAAGLAGEWSALETSVEALGLVSPGSSPAFRTALLDLAALVFDALRLETFDFGTSDLLALLRDAGQRLAEAQAAPPEVPIDLLYLQRKAGGMFLLGTRLRARVGISALLSQHLARSG